jgi:hypothetical protein
MVIECFGSKSEHNLKPPSTFRPAVGLFGDSSGSYRLVHSIACFMTATPPTDALSARKGKVKKQQRAEALRKEKERVSRLREAAHKRDLLDEYPAFKRFDRQGLEVTLESAHGAELSEADTDACIALQRQNIAQLSQTETWNEDTARSALGHPESRMLLLRGTVLPGAVSASTSTPMSALDEWVVVPSASEPEYETPPPTAPRSQPTVLGYLHLQFCIGDNANPTAQPLLCVLNMQLAPPVMGKGLGKFALQFVELIARRNGLELVS